MFESLKTLWKKEQTPLQDYDQQSRQLAEEIARLEQEGRIFVIRPEFPVHVSRMEQNKKKLRELYAEGVRVGRGRLQELYKYLEL